MKKCDICNVRDFTAVNVSKLDQLVVEAGDIKDDWLDERSFGDEFHEIFVQVTDTVVAVRDILEK